MVSLVIKGNQGLWIHGLLWIALVSAFFPRSCRGLDAEVQVMFQASWHRDKLRCTVVLLGDHLLAFSSIPLGGLQLIKRKFHDLLGLQKSRILWEWSCARRGPLQQMHTRWASRLNLKWKA